MVALAERCTTFAPESVLRAIVFTTQNGWSQMSNESTEVLAVFNALINFDIEISEIVVYLHKKYDGIIVESFLESVGVSTN